MIALSLPPNLFVAGQSLPTGMLILLIILVRILAVPLISRAEAGIQGSCPGTCTSPMRGIHVVNDVLIPCADISVDVCATNPDQVVVAVIGSATCFLSFVVFHLSFESLAGP